MKKYTIVLASLTLIATGWTQDMSSANVVESCSHWANLRVDKHKQFKGGTEDAYQTGLCAGYFEGLIDGMNETGGWQLQDGTVAALQIKTSSINSVWDVIRAFYAYTDAHPLAKGKPAWNVLQSVLTSDGLATFVPQVSQSQTPNSTLSAECKTGASNVITTFQADHELKTLDTSTLGTMSDKLIGCWDTKGISDSDAATVLAANTVVQSVLVSRALNVIDRNALMSEFRTERSGSSSQSTMTVTKQ